MRLLERLPGGAFQLVSVDNDNPPPYAILSHTWITDQEVTYGELVAGTAKRSLAMIRSVSVANERQRMASGTSGSILVVLTNRPTLSLAQLLTACSVGISVHLSAMFTYQMSL